MTMPRMQDPVPLPGLAPQVQAAQAQTAANNAMNMMRRSGRPFAKGGRTKKKYAEGGDVNYSENEVSRMKPATPENTKRLQDRARKAGASEAAIDRATKGTVPKFVRGGGIESKGKTRGRFV